MRTLPSTTEPKYQLYGANFFNLYHLRQKAPLRFVKWHRCRMQNAAARKCYYFYSFKGLMGYKIYVHDVPKNPHKKRRKQESCAPAAFQTLCIRRSDVNAFTARPLPFPLP